MLTPRVILANLLLLSSQISATAIQSTQDAMQSIISSYEQALQVLRSPRLEPQDSIQLAKHLRDVRSQISQVESHASEHPHIPYYGQKLRNAVNEALRHTYKLRRDEILGELLRMASTCQNCHQNIQFNTSVKEDVIQHNDLLDFRVFDGPEHALLTRDFRRAFKLYTARYLEDNESDERREYASEQMIDLGIRSIGTHESISQVMSAIKANDFKHLGMSISPNCHNEFQSWIQRKSHKLAIDLFYEIKRDKISQSVSGCKRLKHFYLAGRLSRMKKTHLNSEQLAHIHYARSLLLMSLGVNDPIDQAEILLRRSIELAPHSEVAKDAYNELYFLWGTFYSDDVNGMMPIDLQHFLEELKKEAYDE